MKFTEQQISDWRKYEKVRKGGRFNMFDPRAQSATGLERCEYLFVLKHFDELKKVAEK